MAPGLRINIERLKRWLRAKREEFEDDLYDSYREFLRDEMKGDRFLWQPDPPRTVDDLRRDLNVASRAAYLSGATQAQIDLIVRLATERGDFRGISGGHLTKREASRIIDSMLKDARD